MNKIVVTATIHAPIEKVWECYTNPTHIVNWNFADPSWHCPRAENDMKIGGTYKARMEAKDGSFGFDFEAVYIAINEGKSFTFEFGGRISTYEFNDLGADTLVSITFDPETENSIELQKNGWQLILNNFKLYTENKAK
jgi:uncharacterized protein YndB with AHSA1/START domain